MKRSCIERSRLNDHQRNGNRGLSQYGPWTEQEAMFKIDLISTKFLIQDSNHQLYAVPPICKVSDGERETSGGGTGLGRR